ncbi:hypothetical protein DVH24_042070 [Malus domestica]|uniref:Uncharacterized protein n=1 Tax=Malus domestica TaxID=3750 RepID=A0A498ITR1_MALDO|nr:hypothetical protein DVH24_042070 [Malus domestica]
MSGKICFSAEVEESEKTRVEEGVATIMEKAASPLRKPVTQELAAADEDGEESRFIGKPMEDKEARKQYPKRYVGEVGCWLFVCLFSDWIFMFKIIENSDEDIIRARRHYTKVLVDGTTYDLYEDAHVQVIKHCATVVCGRVFFSDVRDDSPLDCLV